MAALLAPRLPGRQMERTGSPQPLTWSESLTRPIYVDGQRDGGRSILEVEGGGTLQNNRLHRDLLTTMLLDDVRDLVLVVPRRVHGRHPFAYAENISRRLLEKNRFPATLRITVFGYGPNP